MGGSRDIIHSILLLLYSHTYVTMGEVFFSSVRLRHLLLLVGGVQASGCQLSPGPLAFSHGSCPNFCFRKAGSALSCSRVADVVSSFTAFDSGALGCVLAVFRAGTGWRCCLPGASITRGFASQRASARAASIFILFCRVTSAACSCSEGGCSRTWRSHWCQRGVILTSE